MILGNEPWKAWITFAKTRVNLFISSHTFEYIYKKTFSLILSLLPGWGFSFSHAYVQLTLWFKLFRFNPSESFHCSVVVYLTGMSKGLFKTLFSIFVWKDLRKLLFLCCLCISERSKIKTVTFTISQEEFFAEWKNHLFPHNGWQSKIFETVINVDKYSSFEDLTKHVCIRLGEITKIC